MLVFVSSPAVERVHGRKGGEDDAQKQTELQTSHLKCHAVIYCRAWNTDPADKRATVLGPRFFLVQLYTLYTRITCLIDGRSTLQPEGPDTPVNLY